MAKSLCRKLKTAERKTIPLVGVECYVAWMYLKFKPQRPVQLFIDLYAIKRLSCLVNPYECLSTPILTTLVEGVCVKDLWIRVGQAISGQTTITAWVPTKPVRRLILLDSSHSLTLSCMFQKIGVRIETGHKSSHPRL